MPAATGVRTSSVHARSTVARLSCPCSASQSAYTRCTVRSSGVFLIAVWKPCSSAGIAEGGSGGTFTFAFDFALADLPAGDFFVTRFALAGGFLAVVFFDVGFFLLGI